MARHARVHESNIGSQNNLELTSEKMAEKILTIDNMNPVVKMLEYAVRGPLAVRASQIQKELSTMKNGKPFHEVIRANLGDCHAMGQRPITFIRQVLASISFPELLDDNRFPNDVKSRARNILNACAGGSIGSYTNGEGIDMVRKHVAQYIERRDNVPSIYEDIFIFSGASVAIKTVIELMDGEQDGKRPGIMIPIPQYPLYSAFLFEFSMHQIDYYLDESCNWGLNIDELERAVKEAKKVCKPRAIVVINPGNPTGQVLSRQNIEDIIKFAYRERLFILADEVYQDNVYGEECKFYSFKKVLIELGPPYSEMELASFMSCSKGYMGECGVRGGYVELTNLDEQVKQMLVKRLTMLLTPVHGQATLDCIVNPPTPGEESYALFAEEKTSVLKSLAERAKLVEDSFNVIPGISCNPVQGAMYAFPQIKLPEKAIKKAESIGQIPDVFYAFQVLESTGICIVPGSGFGQKPGTYHFRTTIVPPASKLKEMMKKFAEFHVKFLKQYE